MYRWIFKLWVAAALLLLAHALTLPVREWLFEPFRVVSNGPLEPGTIEWIEAWKPDRLIEPSSLSAEVGEDFMWTWTKAEFTARLRRLGVIAVASASFLVVIGTWLRRRLPRHESSTP